MRYEYKIVPAPEKGDKLKGASAEARFAAAVERVLNELAARGWEYQRSDTLPALERSGISGSETQWRNLLVFRRPHAEDASAFHPKLLEAPAPVTGSQSDAADAPGPVKSPRAPESPKDAADVALREALTGPISGSSATTRPPSGPEES